MLATDQLLNAIHLRTQEQTSPDSQVKPKASSDGALPLTELEQRLLKDLSTPEDV